MDELEELNRKNRWWFHLVVLLIAVYLGYPYLIKEGHFGMLDYAIFPFHEAGHFLLMPLGQTLSVWGGTLVQIGLPLAFAVYFFVKRKDPFAASVAAFWMFQTLVNVSMYMKDARFMLLPLFTGGQDYFAVIHDWNYLFGKMRLLHKSVEIGNLTLVIGRLGMVAMMAAMAYWLWINRPGQQIAQASQNPKD